MRMIYPGFGEPDHLKRTVLECCLHHPASLHHDPRPPPNPREVFTHSPRFWSAVCQRPRSTKETLTAINYHGGQKKGIPLCWNIGVRARRTHTQTQTQRDTHHLAVIGLHRVLTNEAKYLWPSEIVQSPCSLDRGARDGNVMIRQPHFNYLTHTHTHTHTHTMLAQSCLCVLQPLLVGLYFRWLKHLFGVAPPPPLPQHI